MIGVIDVGGTKLMAAVSRDGTTLENIQRTSTPNTDPTQALCGLLDRYATAQIYKPSQCRCLGPSRETHPDWDATGNA